MPCQFHSSRFYHPEILCEEYKKAPHYLVFSTSLLFKSIRYLKWTFLSSRTAAVFLECLYTRISFGLENILIGGPSYVKEKYLATSGGKYLKAAESSPRAQESAA